MRGPENKYHSVEAHADVRSIWCETVRCRQAFQGARGDSAYSSSHISMPMTVSFVSITQSPNGTGSD